MNRIYIVILLFILPAINHASTGFPGINISLSLYHGATTNTDHEAGTSSTTKSSNTNFAIGSTHKLGMYFGTIYDLTIKNDGTGNLQDSNLGLSFGFSDRGSYITYHHFLSTSFHLDSVTKYQGTGMGADMGYQLKIGAGFSLGGQFSYRKTTFKEKWVNGQKSAADYSREVLFPSLILGFSF
jgi:hypothetical protein